MQQWENIVEAETVATKRKARNPGVMRHIECRIKNLCEIQQMVIEERMKTDEYMHETRKSGQDKIRDISKVHFHPSHIEHQLLTMTAERRVDKSLIRHTYASRKGYGQIACALTIKKNMRKYIGKKRWVAQCDIKKYYDNIQHSVIRGTLERLFKDKKFIDAFMEPFTRFYKGGKSIPLGIRPSQTTGNMVLCAFDHYMTEDVKAEDYVRYLDDFMFTGETKGEVRRKLRIARKFLAGIGLTLHEPKVHLLNKGVDMMGYVYYGRRNDMWWRKTDKVKWLRRRSKVKNPMRLRELDDAAWGMLKWGNASCRKMWMQKTGRTKTKKEMVKISKCGIKRTERTDANGVPFIDCPKIGMQMLLGKPVVIDKWFGNVKTSQGTGRYAIRVTFMGEQYKLIVNASEIKTFLEDMKRNKVTMFKTMFIDRGSMRYGIDEDKTEILEVCGRKVVEKGISVVFEDTGEIVTFE